MCFQVLLFGQSFVDDTRPKYLYITEIDFFRNTGGVFVMSSIWRNLTPSLCIIRSLRNKRSYEPALIL